MDLNELVWPHKMNFRVAIKLSMHEPHTIYVVVEINTRLFQGLVKVKAAICGLQVTV